MLFGGGIIGLLAVAFLMSQDLSSFAHVKVLLGSNYLSTSNPLPLTFGDSPAVDAFGALRIGNPRTLFDVQNQYNNSPLYWEDAIAVNGAATHVPATASVNLSTTTESGSRAYRQTKQYFRYQPGKSQKVIMTFLMGAGKTNCKQMVGYFDANDGIFLLLDGTTLKWVVRSSVSGSVVDTEVAQSSWNLDVMDGNGSSGITLDITKAQILFIDFEWLGVGRVRCGFVIDGLIYYTHEFLHANSATAPYMKTANLPIRYEIYNEDGTTSGATTLKAICSSVQSEGGDDPQSLTRAASNATTARSCGDGTNVGIIAIRLKSTFNSLVNRGVVDPSAYQLFATTANAHFRVLRNASITGGSWVSAGDNSIVEYNVSMTSFSGGYVVDAGYLASTGNAILRVGTFASPILSKNKLSLNVAGSTSDNLLITAAGFGGTAAVTASVTWKEYY